MSFFTRKKWIFLLAAVLTIAAPGISYAQFGDLKGKAVETLTNNVMKELDKKFTEMVAKEALPADVKSSIVKELSEISRPVVKRIIDSATSGKLPNPMDLANTVIKEVTPRLQNLLTAALTGTLTGSIAQTPGQSPTDTQTPGQTPQTPGQTPAQTPAPPPPPPPRTSPPLVNIAEIQGVAFPTVGTKPVTTITETAQYRGTVKWSPEVSGTFALNVSYSATITLTPKTGFSFEGVEANFFKVSGAGSVHNNADSGVIIAEFPGTMTISQSYINGVPAPKTGVPPVNSILETTQYSGTVTWSPAVSGKFDKETMYTATITLTPKGYYTIEGLEDNFFRITGADKVSNAANTGVIIATFPPTKEIKTIHQEDKKFWSVGASVGTAFAAPLAIGTLHGTIAPFNGLFIDIGADAGYGIIRADVEYFSLYPFVNLALFVPFPRLTKEKGSGWYIGAGFGAMIANYKFESAGEIGSTVFAMNIVTGLNLLDMIDLSYTIRTNFGSVDNKLSIGYVYRFK